MAHNLNIVFSKKHESLVDYMFEQMEHRLHLWPDHRAFLIVPEPMKADMERHYITKAQVGGLMMAEVLSFSRLATRLFAESGMYMTPPLSRAGKAILAQKILLDENISFRRFQRLAGRPQYAAELVRILGDFQRYDISTEDLLQLEKNVGQSSQGNPATIDKLYDFALLKKALDEELEERELTDPDRTLSNLADLLVSSALPERLHFLTKAHIWIIGFGGERQFTSQETEIIRGLASHVSALTISITADYAGGDRGELAFQHGRSTIDSLSRMFPGIRVSQPENLSKEITKKREQPTVKLVRAIDMREEARYCAGQVRELLLSEEFRRKDIGIALCDEQQMPNLIETALAEFGVDAWVDIRKPLTQSSFLRTVIAFLSLCSYDFTLDDLMNYYRNGLSRLTDDMIDSLENASLALGWTTARDFRELSASKALLNKALYGRYHVIDKVKRDVRIALYDVFRLLDITSKMRQTRNGHDKVERLLDFLFKGSLKTKVMARRNELIHRNHADSASLLVSSWNATVDFLNESKKLLGKTRISQDHFTQLILAGLEGLALPSVPFGVDRVRVGSLQSMATWPCRVLFILGATESAFPPEVRQQGYLRDEERDFLSAQIKKPFPNRRKDQPASQAWLVQMLLTRPTSLLYLSVPSFGEEQSHIFDDLREKLSAHVAVFAEPDHIPDVRWKALPAAHRIMRWNTEAPSAWKSAVDKMTESKKQPVKLAHENAEHYVLSEELARDTLYLWHGVSVSSLQQYNACPFRFFAQYVVQTSEREIAQDEPRVQGTMLHRLVELATNDLMDRLSNLETAEEIKQAAESWRREVGTDYMRKLYDLATFDRGLGWYARPSLSGSIGERLRLSAAKTIHAVTEFSEQESYTPRLLEWYFPNHASAEYNFEVNGEKFTLRGLIDRVEENLSGSVRIIDFKRSGQDFSWLGLYDGTDLQLPLYKKAFERAFPDKNIKELYFCGFDRPHARDFMSFDGDLDNKEETLSSLQKQKKQWQGDEAQRAADYAEQKAIETIRNIMSGEFSATPVIRGERENPCQHCPWRAACGYDNRLARNKPLPSDRETVKEVRETILGEITK